MRRVCPPPTPWECIPCASPATRYTVKREERKKTMPLEPAAINLIYMGFQSKADVKKKIKIGSVSKFQLNL